MCVLCVCLVITSTLFYLYTCIVVVVYSDHYFTVIYLQTCVLCVCLVITSTLFYLYIFIVVMLCIQIITLLLYSFRLVYSVSFLLLFVHCFIIILVLLCYVSRSSLYCNIPSDLCTLCFSCYYFYIVLSLYLYCCYVVYLDHHFTVIYLQTCVLCVCLVITSTLFYLYTCIVVTLYIQITTLL